MKFLRIVLMAALIVTVVQSAALFAQTEGEHAAKTRAGRLKGNVTDLDGKAIKGVTVNAVHSETGQSTRTSTNTKGDFMILGIQDGYYVLSFSKDGFQSAQQRVRANAQGGNRVIKVKLTPTGAQESGVDLQALNQQATAKFQAGEFAEAAQLFIQIAEANPALTFARLNAGVCYFQLNDFDKALEQFLLVLEREPENVNALTYAATVYLNSKQDAVNAEIYYEKLSALKGDDINVWYTLGELYNYNRKHEKAIDAFKEVLKLKPDHFEAQMAVGKTQLVAKQYDYAIETFKAVLLANESNVEVRLLIGAALHDSGKYEEAITYLEEYLDLAPDDPNASRAPQVLALSYYELGLKFLRDDKYLECSEYFEKYLLLDPDSTKAGDVKEMLGGANYELGTQYLDEGKNDEGIKRLQRFLELQPDSPLAKDAQDRIEKAKQNQ